MPDVHEIVEPYIAAWIENDPVRRRALVVRAFSEDASYLDR